MIEQITIVLLIIVSIMMVLTFIGVGIIKHNIKDKPDLTIDYDGFDKLGLTCNDDEESTDDLKCLKCGSKNLTGSATKGYGIFYCLDCGYTSEFNTETDFQVCDYGCELIKEEQGNK